MDALELLTTRQSDSNLSFPGPNLEQLEIIKKAALKVPDHGGLAPWKFIVVEEDGRDKLGEIYYQAAVAEQQDERTISRAKELPQRAPMLIIAVSPYMEHPKVPRIEQIECTASIPICSSIGVAAHSIKHFCLIIQRIYENNIDF